MSRKTKSKKRAKVARKGSEKPVASGPDIVAPDDDIVAPDDDKVAPVKAEPAKRALDLSLVVAGRDAQLLLDGLARQIDLLEIIALSTARMMMIADHENRMAGETRSVPDPHGLRYDVEKLLTRSVMSKTLLPVTDEQPSDEGSDDD